MAGSRKKVVEPKKEVPVKAKKAVAKKKNPSTATTTNPSASAVSSSLGDHNKKVVTIEACKQWNAFKTRANAIAKAVGDKAIVEINKEKPGKGNFVVKVDGNAVPIVELLGLKRPFPPLKALDMEDVNAKVLKALLDS